MLAVAHALPREYGDKICGFQGPIRKTCLLPELFGLVLHVLPLMTILSGSDFSLFAHCRKRPRFRAAAMACQGQQPCWRGKAGVN
jgi:hypothetical protein